MKPFGALLGLQNLLMHLREAPKKEMNIPQPRFLLRDPNDKKPTSIYCHLRFNNDRIVFTTGEKIHPKEWDSEKQRAINSKKFPHNSELNIWLDKIDSEIKSIFRFRSMIHPGFSVSLFHRTFINIRIDEVVERV